jgi:hypothetical protein
MADPSPESADSGGTTLGVNWAPASSIGTFGVLFSAFLFRDAEWALSASTGTLSGRVSPQLGVTLLGNLPYEDTSGHWLCSLLKLPKIVNGRASALRSAFGLSLSNRLKAG